MDRRTFIGSSIGFLGLASLSGVPSVAGGKLDQAEDELLEVDGLGLARLVRAGEVSPAELVEMAARRISRLDGKIGAMTTLSLDRARQRAGTIPRDSVFAGVPTALKDLVDVAGIRRTSGSMWLLNNVPSKSPDYIRAMERAGLNFLGMTNTPEFASMGITNNHAFGPTRNPWSLAHSSGGSSGGAAAAVAAGYVPIAHGTDGGGSNRIPASCCGVLGMKASRYRMACGEVDGKHMLLRTHQCLSRTVRDSAAVFAATENREVGKPLPTVGMIEGSTRRRLKIAFTTANCFGQEADQEVKWATLEAAKLCADLGHELIEVHNPLQGEQLFTAIESIMLVGMPKLLAMVESLTGKSAEASGLLTPLFVQTGRYAQQLPAESYQDGVAYTRQLTEQMSRFYKSYDVWLTPVIPVETPHVEYITPDSDFMATRQISRGLLSYTAFANAVGSPAMSVPLNWSRLTGLPIGSQFSAAPGDDRTLYELAYELEEAKPWRNRWAPVSARFKV